jgi:hypothetical protein
MVTLFDKLAPRRAADKSQGKPERSDQASWLGIAFSSHPLERERVIGSNRCVILTTAQVR